MEKMRHGVETQGPGAERLRALAADYRMIPVWKTIPQGAKSPVEVFRILKNLSRHCFILESLEDAARWGRYTFLGYDPKLEISCKNSVLTIKNGAHFQIRADNPGSHAAQIIEDNKSPSFPELPPFTGGLVGYFSYDYVRYSEPGLRLDADGPEHFKDMDLMLFDKLIAWDNLQGTITLIRNIKTDHLEENYNRAQSELEYMLGLIQGAAAAIAPLQIRAPFRRLFTKDRYCAMVEQVKRYIREGDIFQAVLSNQLEADVSGSLFGAYLELRRINPSPYMFFFSSDALEIAGASPETLVRLEQGELFTFPLAGTRKRGEDEEEDEALERELLADPKELAEHHMLVDLGRNDLGRISLFGSVSVEKYLTVQRFSHVMHLGSTVKSRIRQDKNALDAIAAVLPAGTLSGAPKIRACEIINELEGCQRGVYGGAVGYIAFTGNMDTCIAIRIAYKKNGKVFVRSGAGIVADSNAESEYQECENKMRAVIAALERASQEPPAGPGAPAL